VVSGERAPKGRKSIARGVSPWNGGGNPILNVVLYEKAPKGRKKNRNPAMPQSFVCLHCHIVFSTKNRKPWITSELAPRLHDYIGGIIRGVGGLLISAGGMSDHTHLLVSLGKMNSAAELVRDVKSNSSGWIHKTFPDLAHFGWQPDTAHSR